MRALRFIEIGFYPMQVSNSRDHLAHKRKRLIIYIYKEYFHSYVTIFMIPGVKNTIEIMLLQRIVCCTANFMMNSTICHKIAQYII